MRVLVTGFGPFPRMPRNPSAVLAQVVASAPRLRLHRIEARAAVLTTAYAALAHELDPLLAARPDAVLLIGVAGRAAKVRVETRATSRRSTLFPDAFGDMPSRPGSGSPSEPPSSASRPASRRTRVHAVSALRALASRAVPGRLSRDAGRYLCNAAYFRALGRPMPALFVHIPRTPLRRRARGGGGRLVDARWNAALAASLVDIAVGMAREARCVVRGPALR